MHFTRPCCADGPRQSVFGFSSPRPPLCPSSVSVHVLRMKCAYMPASPGQRDGGLPAATRRIELLQAPRTQAQDGSKRASLEARGSARSCPRLGIVPLLFPAAAEWMAADKRKEARTPQHSDRRGGEANRPFLCHTGHTAGTQCQADAARQERRAERAKLHEQMPDGASQSLPSSCCHLFPSLSGHPRMKANERHSDDEALD